MKVRLLERRRGLAIAAATLLMLMIAGADLVMGPELSFGIFLLIPVVVCSWLCTRRQRLALCITSACVWLSVDILSEQGSLEIWIPAWNALLRLGVFVMVSELTARVLLQRAALEMEIAQRKRVEVRLREANDSLEQKVAERTQIIEKRSAELAQSETALRRHAGVLRSILESMSDGIVVLDEVGNVLLCNPEAKRLLAISIGATSFQDWLQGRETCRPPAVEGPLVGSSELARLKETARTGKHVLNVQIVSKVDGAERTTTWNAVPLRNESGQASAAVAVGRDITELKNAEQHLVRSNFELEQIVRERTLTLAERAALLELSFDAIIVRDSCERITYWNSGAQEMYGWRREEVEGTVTHDLFKTQFPEPLEQIQKELQRAGRWSGEVVHTKRDGSRITVATRWAVRLGPTGQSIAVLETNSDITQQRQLEVALRQTLERKVAERTAIVEKRSAQLAQSEMALRRQAQVLQSILNSMGDGVIVADAEGRILLCNPEAERLLGVAGADGRLHDRLKHGRVIENDMSGRDSSGEHPLIRALKGEIIDGVEMLMDPETESSGVYVFIKTRPLMDEGGELHATVMVFSDVTVRKSLERQVAEISEREQRRIGQDLHDGVCQQLVSSAYACNMLSEALAEKGLSEAAQAFEIYRLIQDATLQARNLARALHPADLTGEGLSSALEELGQTAEDATGIRCRCVTDGSVIITDQGVGTHLYRIAQEALNNAVKHSHASQILIELVTLDGMNLLKVSDNGHGFQSGLRPRGGMGLDTMSHRARMIGASLYVGAAPGGGTLVACSLRQNSPFLN